jgi:hypothetical protein
VADWLVITADRIRGGRGIRGHALTWFLRTYFGRRSVAQQAPDQIRHSPTTAETVFLGLPSSLTPDDIGQLVERTRCRRVIPFDYRDRNQLAWTEEQATALRSVACCYLKPWYDPAWNFNIRMGMLPVRRLRRFRAAVAIDRSLSRAGLRPRPKYDVAFLGMPNSTRLYRDGRVRKLDQRVAWVREIKRRAPELKFWGGLIKSNPRELRRIQLIHGDVDDLFYVHPRMHRKISFSAYWLAIRQSRVLLAPGGNVPWTYRHYEALYAGAAVVSNDFRERDMLIPLPKDRMIHVPDGAAVLPAVHEALALQRESPTLAEENFAHLEQYLKFGGYDRGRRTLLDRFLAQIA